MRVLHTSDWHLGRSFYGSRHGEIFAAFLDWLASQAEQLQADVLLVAGDVFDTVTPGNLSQSLYYRFLSRMAHSSCRHVVVTAGNHDSPTFLDAPQALLRHMRIHVIGAVKEDPREEVLVLENAAGCAEAVICAVPFLRDRDIRTVSADESADDKNARLLAGISEHYAAVCGHAEQIRQNQPELPLIAMGHLFTAGGRTTDDDGVRDLYVGSLAHVPARLFPEGIDYLALGHLHLAQAVGGNPAYRYAGSPLPMGFGEAGQSKQILQIDFKGRKPVVTALDVPCFQPLQRICGDLSALMEQIGALRERNSTAWLEVICDSPVRTGNLRELVEEAVAGTAMEIRRIKNRQAADRVLAAMQEDEFLDELDIWTVFRRCLDQNEVPEADRCVLERSFREILLDMDSADQHAEA